MRIDHIISLIEAVAPTDYAADWDNVGLQVGDRDGTASSCLLTIDTTWETVGEARRRGASLIISHHPVIFEPLSTLTSDQPNARAILAAIRNGLRIYAAHTNLDASISHGTAAALADRLGVERGQALIRADAPSGRDTTLVSLVGPAANIDAVIETVGLAGNNWQQWMVNTQRGEGDSAARREMVLPVAQVPPITAAAADAGLAVSVLPRHDHDVNYGLGMVVHVPDMSLHELAGYVRRRLGGKHLRLVGDPDKTLNSVALLPGSGGAWLNQAAAKADALITGQIGHHEALRARQLQLGIVTAGHYETERPVLDLLARYIQQNAEPDFEVAITQTRTDPFQTPAD